MNNLHKLFRQFRIRGSLANPHSFTQFSIVTLNHSFGKSVHNLEAIRVRTMAQKSITSFFKITPKKTAALKEEAQESPGSASPVEEPATSPITNGKTKEKISSNRQRLDSSGDESPKPVKRKSSPPSADNIRELRRRDKAEGKAAG